MSERIPGIGIRELRADLATRVRRAQVGETTVVTVNGRPAAQLGPFTPERHDAAPTLAALVAAGAVLPPRRSDGRVDDRTVAVWGNVRLDRLLREIRG